MIKLFLSASLALGCLGAMPAYASTIVDPTGDFLPSYVGPANGDLDVTRFTVSYDSATTSFLLAATLAGAIDPSTVGFYVIGVNTGTGTIRPFAALGQPNVIFNQAIVVRKDGTGNIGATVLDPAAITISGDSFSVQVTLGLLPSTGFSPERYGFNLWPRIGMGNSNQISDFAPDNANLAAVPEPATWGMMLVGFGLIGGALRSRRRWAAPPGFATLAD